MYRLVIFHKLLFVMIKKNVIFALPLCLHLLQMYQLNKPYQIESHSPNDNSRLWFDCVLFVERVTKKNNIKTDWFTNWCSIYLYIDQDHAASCMQSNNGATYFFYRCYTPSGANNFCCYNTRTQTWTCFHHISSMLKCNAA